MTDDLARLIKERDRLEGRIAEARAADRDAFEEALERLYEAVLAYAAEHQLPVVEEGRKNVDVVSFAGLRVELAHDAEPGYGDARHVAVVDEQLGCSAWFEEAPPPPQALLGLITGFRAARPASPTGEGP